MFKIITELDLSNRGLKFDDVEYLIEVLQQHPELVKLNLSRNQFGQLTPELIKAFIKHPALIEVDLSDNGYWYQDTFTQRSGRMHVLSRYTVATRSSSFSNDSFNTLYSYSAPRFNDFNSHCAFEIFEYGISFTGQSVKYELIKVKKDIYRKLAADVSFDNFTAAITAKRQLLQILTVLNTEWTALQGNRISSSVALFSQCKKMNLLHAEFITLKKDNQYLVDAPFEFSEADAFKTFLEMVIRQLLQPFADRLQALQRAQATANIDFWDYEGLRSELQSQCLAVSAELGLSVKNCEYLLLLARNFYSNYFAHVIITLDNFTTILSAAKEAHMLLHPDTDLFFSQCFNQFLFVLARQQNNDIFLQNNYSLWLSVYYQIKSCQLNEVDRQDLLARFKMMFAAVPHPSGSDSLLNEFRVEALAFMLQHPATAENHDQAVFCIRNLLNESVFPAIERFRQNSTLAAVKLPAQAELRVHLSTAVKDIKALSEFVSKTIAQSRSSFHEPPNYLDQLTTLAHALSILLSKFKPCPQASMTIAPLYAHFRADATSLPLHHSVSSTAEDRDTFIAMSHFDLL